MSENKEVRKAELLRKAEENILEIWEQLPPYKT